MKKQKVKKTLSYVLALVMVVSLMTVSGVKEAKAKPETDGISSVTVAGTGTTNWLNGLSWNPSADVNHMKEIEEDIWEITYGLVGAGDCQFKFVTNNDWNSTNFGNPVDFVSGKTQLLYNGGENCRLAIAETSNVTLRLDLREYTGSAGAKAVVLVNAVEETSTEGESVTKGATVSYDIANLSYTGMPDKNVGIEYYTRLVPMPDYELPTSIVVTLGGQELVVGTDYTYDNTTGEVIINADQDNGTIVIEACATAVVDDSVEPEVNYPIYVVVGTDNLTGFEWQVDLEGNDDNLMTETNGVFSKTYTNVQPGNYSFKVVCYTAKYAYDWIGAGTNHSDNVTFTVKRACDVTITCNAETKDITVVGDGIGGYELTNMSMAGSAALFGADWQHVAMKETSEGSNVWVYTVDNVPKGEYVYKYTADNDWTHSWGIGGYYNGSNCPLTVSYDDSKVVFTVDLNGIDFFEPSEVNLGSVTTVEVLPPSSFTVTYDIGENLIVTQGPKTIGRGDELYVVLQAKEGYVLPETITVLVDGVACGTDMYGYLPESGEICVIKSATIGNITIIAEAVEKNEEPKEPEQYTVTYDIGDNLVVVQGPETIEHEEEFYAIIEAKEGYVLPGQIIIVVGDVTCNIKMWTYSPASGEIRIDKSEVIGDITITAEAEEKGEDPIEQGPYTVTYEVGDNLIVTQGPETIGRGDELYVVLQAKEGYVLPETITILVDGVACGTDMYGYLPESGEICVIKAATIGNITIVAEAVEKQPEIYDLTITVENITYTGDTEVIEGQEVVVTLTAEEGHSLPEAIIVKCDEERLAVDNYSYDSETGVVRIFEYATLGDIEIIAVAVEIEEPGEEPGTNPEEPGTNPDEPGTNPDEPGTNPDEPGTNPDEPGTNPDEPGINPDEPSTEPEEEKVVVDLTEDAVISESEFTSILEENETKDVEIKLNDEISFTFAQGTMQEVEGKTDYDFSATINKVYSEELPSYITADNLVFVIDYNYSGQLPGEASIKIFVGVEYAGDTLYYSFMKDDGTFENVQAVVTDAEGYITVKQDHCSSYVITTEEPVVDGDDTPDGPNEPGDKPVDKPTDDSTDKDTPDTGDINVSAWGILLVAGLAAMLGITIYNKKVAKI